MRALWLASWYPVQTDPFNGDFIQRHAASAATRGPITLLHVEKISGKRGKTITTTRKTGDLTEKITYFNSPDVSFRLWRSFHSQLKTFLFYHKMVKEYTREHGRPSFIHVHVCMHAGVYALWAKWRWKIPYVVTEHYSIYIPGNPGSFYSRPFLYRYINKLILREASGVHNVSGFLQDCIQQIVPLRNPTIIPNVVNTDLFRPQGVKEKPPAGWLFRFVHVSSFEVGKNVRGILEAFRLLAQRRTDWELILVGPADEDIRLYGSPISQHLQWTGAVPYEEVANHLQQADVLVLFSHFENQPCVISEAFCCGLPVVSSAVGGIPEVVLPENGLLVRAGDVQGLVQMLDQIMTTYDRYDRQRIGEEATAKHGYPVVASSFNRFYAAAFK